MYYVYQKLGNGQSKLVGGYETPEEVQSILQSVPNTFVLTQEELMQYQEQPQQPQQRRGIVPMPRRRTQTRMNPNPGVFRPKIVKRRF